MSVAMVNAPNVANILSSTGPASSSLVVDGKPMTVQDMMLLMTLNSLKSQDAVFENLFRECEERTQLLNKLSTCMQILGKYRDYFDKDGNPIKNKHGDTKMVWMDLADREKLKAAGVEDLVKAGLIPGMDNLDKWFCFTKGGFDSGMENMKLAQSQVSSVNEQQMMRANQAANKRSTILQFGQSLLQSIKEANQAASR